MQMHTLLPEAVLMQPTSATAEGLQHADLDVWGRPERRSRGLQGDLPHAQIQRASETPRRPDSGGY